MMNHTITTNLPSRINETLLREELIALTDGEDLVSFSVEWMAEAYDSPVVAIHVRIPNGIGLNLGDIEAVISAHSPQKSLKQELEEAASEVKLNNHILSEIVRAKIDEEFLRD